MSDRFSTNNCQVHAFLNGMEVLAILRGSLRMGDSERVKQLLLGLMSPPVECLDLFLGELNDLDSAGLGILVGLHMTARKNKQELRILAPTAHQMGLFESTRLTKMLTILTGTEAEHIRLSLALPEFEVDLSRYGGVGPS